MQLNTWKKEAQDLSLLDEEFLATLLEQKERTIYARIASLDINELPIDYIEGRVTGGSINIDGSSAIRRTCSLTMISEDIDINEFYWGIKTKFKLEIGLVNKLTNQYAATENGQYPDIVWFPEGTFLITSFNTTLNINTSTISLQGKDKMCLLNGDLGGQLFASVDFGQEEIKTTVMTKSTVDANTSDVLMTNKYYIKNPTIEDVRINLTNPLYTFVLSENGLYYKKDNFYTKGTIVIDENNKEKFYTSDNILYFGNRYDVYKLVMHPNELYEQISDGEYEENKFFFKKNNGQGDYYVLNTTKSPKPAGNNYRLVDLYLKEYEYLITKTPIEKIIRESIHAYAQEPYHNIIINDLDDYGLEQLTYRGENHIYALRNFASGHFTNLMLQANATQIVQLSNGTITNLGNFLENNSSFSPDTLSHELVDSGCTLFQKINNSTFTLVSYGEASDKTETDKQNIYSIAVIQYGDDIGYRITDLTYTGDLVTSIGDTLVSILDKIKGMLGDFEYFYDVYGRFVFQRKRNYVNTSWSQITNSDDEDYVDYVNSDHQKFSFNFEGNRLVTAIQNSPVLNNLRNDFIVWGKRKSVSGADLAIHARYAIDKKPSFYKSLSDKIYITRDWIAENPTDPLITEAEHAAEPFIWEKAPVPECLWNDLSGNSDWWEVSNWGKWYELQIGAPPSGRMMNYQTGTEGFKGVINFPNGQILDTTNSRYGGQLMIDLDENGNPYQGAKVPGELYSDGRERTYGSYNQHGWGGCGHNFLLVLQVNAYNPGMHSYIYKPVLPDEQTQQEDIEHKDENPLTTPEEEYPSQNIFIVDWREIIYQMALDYFAAQGCSAKKPIYNINNEVVITAPDHLLSAIAERNPRYFPTGYTGYEQYYTDMQGFWRQLYNPEYVPVEKWVVGKYSNEYPTGATSNSFVKQKQWKESYISDYEFDYYVSLGNIAVQDQYSKLLDLWSDETDETEKNRLKSLLEEYRQHCITQDGIEHSEDFEQDKNRMYWNTKVFSEPEKLDFWIDFLDGDELSEFSVPMVGDRTKTVNEDKAGAIVFKEIPGIILRDMYKTNEYGEQQTYELDLDNIRKEITSKSGYSFVFLPKGFSKLLTISYRSISVKNKIDELLYQYAYCIENISITALPIYHLQPNTRIFVQDKKTGINGEYIVTKITLPLTYNGTMSVTANKAPERFY